MLWDGFASRAKNNKEARKYSVLGTQLSALSSQLSALSSQLSALSSQLSALSSLGFNLARTKSTISSVT
jgi:prefoldin subunit 5